MPSESGLTLRRILLVTEIARLENRSPRRALKKALSAMGKGLAREHKELARQLMGKPDHEITRVIQAAGLWGWDERGNFYFKDVDNPQGTVLS